MLMRTCLGQLSLIQAMSFISIFRRLGKLITTGAPVPIGLDYTLRVTGTLFLCYFSRTCINRSVGQLYLGVLIPCVVGTILIRYCYSSCGCVSWNFLY